MTAYRIASRPLYDTNSPDRELRLPALEVRQGEGRVLYSFVVDGKQVPSFAAISRIRRDRDAEIEGYQRSEVQSHIASIRRYLESVAPMIPNSLVIAFDRRVRFVPLPGGLATSFARHGTLIVPLSEDAADRDKPGWVVDGQQRMAAIRDARIDSFRGHLLHHRLR
jgi:DGQHR domain-containing protein